MGVSVYELLGGPTRNKVRCFAAVFEFTPEKIAAACREAVGDDFDFVLECHRGLTVPEAISFAKQVEQYHPLFLEDPIAPDSSASMAEVAGKK